jgi:hypothetical protein
MTPVYVFFLACVAWALLGSLFTAMADRKDVAHYYETYEWAELADGLHVASMLGLIMPSFASIALLAQLERFTGSPASTVGLVVLAVVAALLGAAAVGILRYGHRILVPGSLTGAGAGMCLLAVLGLAGIHQLDLVATAALGWVVGVGAAIVIMIIVLVVMAVTDGMP